MAQLYCSNALPAQLLQCLLFLSADLQQACLLSCILSLPYPCTDGRRFLCVKGVDAKCGASHTLGCSLTRLFPQKQPPISPKNNNIFELLDKNCSVTAYSQGWKWASDMCTESQPLFTEEDFLTAEKRVEWAESQRERPMVSPTGIHCPLLHLPFMPLLPRQRGLQETRIGYVTTSNGENPDDRFMSWNTCCMLVFCVHKCASFFCFFLCNCPYAHKCELRS